MKNKRTISLKAVQAALKSPKTPESLRSGLLKKYGHLFKNAPRDWHVKKERDEHEKWLKTKDPLDKFYHAGKIDAHRESRRYKENETKRSNPAGRSELIYDKALMIQAQKGKSSHWPNEKFEHKFTSGAKIYGNPDGSLTIKGKKPLWSKKRYSEKDLKQLGGKFDPK